MPNDLITYNGRPVNYVVYNGKPVKLEDPAVYKHNPEDSVDMYDEKGRYNPTPAIAQRKKFTIRDRVAGELSTVNKFRRGYNDMQDNLGRYGDDKYPVMGAAGRSLISTANGLVYVVSPSSFTENPREYALRGGPSAVTRTDGPKLTPMIRVSGTRKGRRRPKRSVTVKVGRRKMRGPTNYVRNLASKNIPRLTTRQMQILKEDVRTLRRTGRTDTRILRAPVAMGGVYAGTATKIRPVLRREGKTGNSLNCSNLKTRLFLGQLVLKALTGNTSFIPAATGETGGQWFFLPTNQYYWPTGSTVVILSRMYQFYYLKSCSFEVESNVQPGQPTATRLYYGFIDDPNLGESYITSYTTIQNVTVGNILQLPTAKSEPSWKPLIRFAPPRRWYAGKKFTNRNYLFNDPMVTSTNDTVAQNKQACPFAAWMTIKAPVPVADTVVADVFINIDIDFCDLAPQQTFNNIGTNVLQTPSDKKKESTIVEKLEVKSQHKESEVTPTSSHDYYDLGDRDDEVVSVKRAHLQLKSKSAK